jgi:hypothetical protein
MIELLDLRIGVHYRFALRTTTPDESHRRGLA